MRFALICNDRPGALQTRLETRAAHLEYINATGCVEMAGPLLDAGGQMTGSLLVLDLPDLASAQAWADADPYALAGVFARVEIRGWNKVIG